MWKPEHRIAADRMSFPKIISGTRSCSAALADVERAQELAPRDTLPKAIAACAGASARRTATPHLDRSPALQARRYARKLLRKDANLTVAAARERGRSRRIGPQNPSAAYCRRSSSKANSLWCRDLADATQGTTNSQIHSPRTDSPVLYRGGLVSSAFRLLRRC